MINSNLNKTVAILGGTGFIGQSIIKVLAKEGYRLRVGVRNTYSETVLEIKTQADPGQIELIKLNIDNHDQVKNFLEDVTICINTIGILFEKEESAFEKLHFQLVEQLVKIIKEKSNIKHFIHFSSLGVKENTESKYLNSKFKAEQEIKKKLDNYTIIKPSVVFGNGSKEITNMFAKLASIFPIIPLAGADVKFQPVYVGDVAQGVKKIIEEEYKKEIFEFGGDEIFSLKELVKLISNEIRKNNIIIPIPSWAARIQGSILGLMPNPILTLDQIKTLESGNNILTNENKTLKDLNIHPEEIRKIIPSYLWRYRSEGQYSS
jgi:uncharacterized protein YbjT (DUF2867 family)